MTEVINKHTEHRFPVLRSITKGSPGARVTSAGKTAPFTGLRGASFGATTVVAETAPWRKRSGPPADISAWCAKDPHSTPGTTGGAVW